METFALTRTKQCAKCPWKVTTNPHEIPDGYCEVKHQNLNRTIAKHMNAFDKIIHVMACHHSTEDNKQYCVGWLHNQLGPGNNIAMRLHMRNCTNIQDLQVVGDQHPTFEDTLPKHKL